MMPLWLSGNSGILLIDIGTSIVTYTLTMTQVSPNNAIDYYTQARDQGTIPAIEFVPGRSMMTSRRILSPNHGKDAGRIHSGPHVMQTTAETVIRITARNDINTRAYSGVPKDLRGNNSTGFKREHFWLMCWDHRVPSPSNYNKCSAPHGVSALAHSKRTAFLH